MSLLVWCSWRASVHHLAVASSDSDVAEIVTSLNRFVGRSITDIDFDEYTGDARITFSDNALIEIFCDRVGAGVNHQCDWEMRVDRQRILVGVGGSLRFYSDGTAIIGDVNGVTPGY